MTTEPFFGIWDEVEYIVSKNFALLKNFMQVLWIREREKGEIEREEGGRQTDKQRKREREGGNTDRNKEKKKGLPLVFIRKEIKKTET